MSEYAPCPKCAALEAERVRFTWWGGLIGPKILSHVKCGACGHAYNGRSGRDNTAGIIVYSGVVALVVFGLVIAMFAALGALMYASR